MQMSNNYMENAASQLITNADSKEKYFSGLQS